MSKPNKRRVRMSQFKEQIAEAVLPSDGVVTIELDDERSVSIRIPLVPDPDDEYIQAISEAKKTEDLARVLLGDEQWETWTEAGYDAQDIAKVYASETAAAKERLRDFRYKG